MILAVVLSQIPMPEAQAEETSTVTFSMNGGEFNGEYNGYNFKKQTPVLVLDNNTAIGSYPDDQYASYAGYETEQDTWYTDKSCIEKFDQASKISESITIYKKWFSTEEGFRLNPDKSVLYQYSGSAKLVQIPDSVTTIAPNAFDSIANVRGIVLPNGIENVYDNAFSGANQENSIIYIYDNESSQSKEMAQKLAERYEQFVYSSYLDVDKVEEIAGINYDGAENQAENQTEHAAENETENQTENKAENETEHAAESASLAEESKGTETETETASTEQTETETETKTKLYFYVTFIAEGADNVPEKVKLYEDEPINEPSQKPSIKGKTFKGWYTKDGDAFETWGKPLSGNLTLYAQWETDSYTVTFDMNGGKYSGTYDGEEYSSITSVKTKVEKGKGIAKKSYPDYEDDAVFKYSGYKTDSNWYTDKNCLSQYSKTDSNGNAKEIKKNLTLYKKWYATASGFTMNAKKTVLYEYSGSAENVKIPETVTAIGEDAFQNISSIKSVALPDALTDVDDDAFSGFEKASKDVAITAKSDSAIAIAKKLASKYKHLVFDSASSDKAKSDSVSVVRSNDSKSITLGAAVGGNAGTGSTSTNVNANQNTAATSSTSVVPGAAASGTPAAGVTTSGLSADSVTIGETQQAASAGSQTPAASEAAAVSGVPAADAQTPAASGSSSVSSASKTKTTSKTNAAAASAPSGARHVKDSTPKTGDPVQYRMLFVCVLFSAGVLLVLTGNGKRKKFSPS